MKKIVASTIAIVLTVVLIHIFPKSAAGQEDEQEAQFGIKESDREIRDKETRELEITEKAKKVDLDFLLAYGAWVYGSYSHYENIDNDSDTEDWVKDRYIVDTRIWTRAMYYRLLTVYGRIRNTYIWRPNVSSDYTGIGDDYEGPKVDMLYADVNFKYRYDVPFSVRAGRQYLSVGRGITYRHTHDGVQFRYDIGQNIKTKVFLARTQEFEDNIDYSTPGYKDEGDRNFYGAEIGFVLPGITLYGYGLIQRDLSHEYPENLTQNYTYDSEYLGIGFDGRKNNFSYWAEFIKEYGKSYTDAKKAELARKDIDAWAVLAGAKYRFNFYSHPSIEGEFAYGSGDKDRSRVTNTSGGNTDGKDTNFLYFGIYSAGYALAPRISNMYIYKIGASLKPLEFVPYVGKNIAIGSRYYIYQKDRKSGGIYDTDATQTSKDVGQEIDLFFHWKVYENMFVTIRYGLFIPGGAYPKGKRDQSKYIYTRVLMTF